MHWTTKLKLSSGGVWWLTCLLTANNTLPHSHPHPCRFPCFASPVAAKTTCLAPPAHPFHLPLNAWSVSGQYYCIDANLEPFSCAIIYMLCTFFFFLSHFGKFDSMHDIFGLILKINCPWLVSCLVNVLLFYRSLFYMFFSLFFFFLRSKKKKRKNTMLHTFCNTYHVQFCVVTWRTTGYRLTLFGRAGNRT